jgi:hypothetical protein
MKTFALLFAVALAPTVAIAENHLMDDKQTVTYDCDKDASTNIMSNGNTITLKGACGTVNISGTHNKVTGDKARQINISGNDNTLDIGTIESVNVSGNTNTLTYKKGSANAPGPKVSNAGNGNKISATK